MNPTKQLHDLGQSIWLDGISRDLLTNDTLKRYIYYNLWITGLTSNLAIYDQAITRGAAYDGDIRRLAASGNSAEALFFELAVDDLTRAADLFAPIHRSTAGIDGWVALDLSPLTNDTNQIVSSARELHQKASRPNLMITIPGTTERLSAVEEAIFAGLPVNVTLLFSRRHYLAAAEAYMRGLERRVAAGLSPEGLNPNVRSVASLFIGGWDEAVNDQAPAKLHGKLGIAIAQQTYQAYRDLLGSDRWQRLANVGARPQRLLFAGVSSQHRDAFEAVLGGALAAPNTVIAMPEESLRAFSERGRVSGTIARTGGDCEKVLAAFAKAGIDLEQPAAQLQTERAKSLDATRRNILKSLEEKSKTS